MEHLSKEHDDQEKAEAKATQRQEIFAKVRKVFFSVAGVAVVVAAFVYRAEVGQYLSSLTPSKETEEAQSETAEGVAQAGQTKTGDEPVLSTKGARAGFGNNMKLIKGVATERDKILEEVSAKQ